LVKKSIFTEGGLQDFFKRNGDNNLIAICITIQQFFINHKVEKIKELLLYGELSLKEISYQLDYSSVAHLSNQFKKTTGLCPSFYRQMQENRRTNLESV
jgi:AraC-like DNA-binding protein